MALAIRLFLSAKKQAIFLRGVFASIEDQRVSHNIKVAVTEKGNRWKAKMLQDVLHAALLLRKKKVDWEHTIHHLRGRRVSCVRDR